MRYSLWPLEQVPVVAGLPFFIVIFWGLLMSIIFFSFTQYACISSPSSRRPQGRTPIRRPCPPERAGGALGAPRAPHTGPTTCQRGQDQYRRSLHLEVEDALAAHLLGYAGNADRQLRDRTPLGAVETRRRRRDPEVVPMTEPLGRLDEGDDGLVVGHGWISLVDEPRGGALAPDGAGRRGGRVAPPGRAGRGGVGCGREPIGSATRGSALGKPRSSRFPLFPEWGCSEDRQRPERASSTNGRAGTVPRGRRGADRGLPAPLRRAGVPVR